MDNNSKDIAVRPRGRGQGSSSSSPPISNVNPRTNQDILALIPPSFCSNQDSVLQAIPLINEILVGSMIKKSHKITTWYLEHGIENFTFILPEEGIDSVQIDFVSELVLSAVEVGQDDYITYCSAYVSEEIDEYLTAKSGLQVGCNDTEWSKLTSHIMDKLVAKYDLKSKSAPNIFNYVKQFKAKENVVGKQSTNKKEQMFVSIGGGSDHAYLITAQFQKIDNVNKVVITHYDTQQWSLTEKVKYERLMKFILAASLFIRPPSDMKDTPIWTIPDEYKTLWNNNSLFTFVNCNCQYEDRNTICQTSRGMCGKMTLIKFIDKTFGEHPNPRRLSMRNMEMQINGSPILWHYILTADITTDMDVIHAHKFTNIPNKSNASSWGSFDVYRKLIKTQFDILKIEINTDKLKKLCAEIKRDYNDAHFGYLATDKQAKTVTEQVLERVKGMTVFKPTGNVEDLRKDIVLLVCLYSCQISRRLMFIKDKCNGIIDQLNCSEKFMPTWIDLNQIWKPAASGVKVVPILINNRLSIAMRYFTKIKSITTKKAGNSKSSQSRINKEKVCIFTAAPWALESHTEYNLYKNAITNKFSKADIGLKEDMLVPVKFIEIRFPEEWVGLEISTRNQLENFVIVYGFGHVPNSFYVNQDGVVDLAEENLKYVENEFSNITEIAPYTLLSHL